MARDRLCPFSSNSRHLALIQLVPRQIKMLTGRIISLEDGLIGVNAG
jgi:hypothetical protein